MLVVFMAPCRSALTVLSYMKVHEYIQKLLCISLYRFQRLFIVAIDTVQFVCFILSSVFVSEDGRVYCADCIVKHVFKWFIGTLSFSSNHSAILGAE